MLSQMLLLLLKRRLLTLVQARRVMNFVLAVMVSLSVDLKMREQNGLQNDRIFNKDGY